MSRTVQVLDWRVAADARMEIRERNRKRYVKCLCLSHVKQYLRDLQSGGVYFQFAVIHPSQSIKLPGPGLLGNVNPFLRFGRIRQLGRALPNSGWSVIRPAYTPE